MFTENLRRKILESHKSKDFETFSLDRSLQKHSYSIREDVCA